MPPPETRNFSAWITALAETYTTTEVIRIVNNYLASLDATDLSTIPPLGRPPTRIEDVERLVAYTITLVQCPGSLDEDRPASFAITQFFLKATRRVTALMSVASEVKASED